MTPVTSRTTVLAGSAVLAGSPVLAGSAVLAGSVLLAAVLVPLRPAAAQTPAPAGSLELVLDASGSMAGADPSGGSKIRAARSAVAGVLQRLPGGTAVGVRAYGGQYEDQARGCTDTRLVVPVGPVQPAAAVAALAGLRPTGYTPLAASLRAAAADLSPDGPRTVVLVSDGEETCGGDPCAVARELSRDGVGLRVDTVGYGVDAAARAQLSCVAAATGGAYSEAPDGDALDVQLATVAAPGLRRYVPSGTAVAGTPDLLGAPRLAPGQWLDALDGAERSYYSVDLADGVTPYLAATLLHPPGPVTGSSYDSLTLALYGPGGTKCGQTSQTTNQGNGGTASTVVATTPAVGAPWRTGPFAALASDSTCGRAGRYTFSVERDSSSAGQGALPLELRVLAEPPVPARDQLPEAPVTVPSALPPPPVTAPLAQVRGGGDPGDAPLLRTGSSQDAIRQGETLYYRIPVGWGQRLAFTASLPPGTDKDLPTATVTAKVVGPSRQQLPLLDGDVSSTYFGGSYDSDGATLSGSTAPVLYRNRDVRDDDLTPVSLAGDHYLVVQLAASKTPSDVAVPLRLAVSVTGDAAGAPSYADAQGAQPPDGTAQASRSGGSTTTGGEGASDGATGRWRTVAYTGGGALALVLAGSLVLLPLLRGRRRSRP